MILVNDIILRARDHCGNYSTEQSTEAQFIRAVDSSVNKVFQRLGFPQGKQTIYFSEDVVFYDLDAIFREYINLVYTDSDLNIAANYWEYQAYNQLAKKSGSTINNRCSITTINNSNKQLALRGTNIQQGATLESFDTTLWTASGDVSGIALDTNIKVQGAASQRFTFTQNTLEAVVGRDDYQFDFTSLHNNYGALRCYHFMSSVDFDDITLRYGTDSSNYYEITITANADGSAWELNDWNLLGFDTRNKVITGSPDESDITFIEFVFDMEVGFGTVQNYRIDWLYTVYPDELDLLFYTNVKGETSTGTAITTITATTDYVDAEDDWIELFAMESALYVFPQLRGDKEYMMLYSQNKNDMIKLWARQNPRIRNQNNYQDTRLRR